MSKYRLGCVLGIWGVLLFSLSSFAQSPIRTESLPPTPEVPEERPAEEGTLRATLDAQVRPALPAQSPRGSIELEATKVPTSQPPVEAQGVEWIVVIVGLLFLSLLGNAFQLYRQKLHGKTMGNELVSTFNSIAWSLARCNGKTKELDGRLTSPKVADPVLLKEFREFTVNFEFILRALNEQLVSVAKNLGQNNKRWQEGPMVQFPDGIDNMHGADPARRAEGSETA